MGKRYLSCRAESAILTCDSVQAQTDLAAAAAQHNKHKHRQKQKKQQQKAAQFEDPYSAPNIQHFDYADLEAATDGFSPLKLLGRGSHGSVYKGVLRSGSLVAIKIPSRPHHPQRDPTSSSSAASSASTEVENEIEILSKLRSPRLVNLIGFSSSSSPTGSPSALVVEFMSNGTLFDALHTLPRPPGWSRRLRLALHTALAVETLHSATPPVIHRDIKSANVLIDRALNARLGDFGLAVRCHADDFRLRSTPPAGTLGYLDPCYVTPDNLSTKTDVFSFGILLLEIISGRKAIDVAHSPPSIVDWALPLVRRGKLMPLFDPRIPPPKDPLARKHLVMLAAKCVRSCRERRPSMNEVVEALKVLSKTVPGHLWDNLAVNPCMMVDEVGQAIGTRNPNPNSGTRQQKISVAAEEAPIGSKRIPNLAKPGKVMRNTSRVFSDLGSTSRNLKDLLAGAEKESEDESLASSIRRVRGGSGRSSSSRRKSQLPIRHDYDSDGILRLRADQG